MVFIAGKTVWSMPERFKVVCITCKVLYKCSALPFTLLVVSNAKTLHERILCNKLIDRSKIFFSRKQVTHDWQLLVSKLTWFWKGPDGYVNTWNDDVIDLCVDGDGVDGSSRETDNAHSDEHINSHICSYFFSLVAALRCYVFFCAAAVQARSWYKRSVRPSVRL